MSHLISIIGTLSVFFVLALATVEAKTKLSFAINTPGSAPYIYLDEETESYQGVIVDFFATFEPPNDFEVIYKESSRARIEQVEKTAKADVFLTSAFWLENPDKFILSDPLMTHNSYLYATQAFARPFDATQNKLALICTRVGFVYPKLGRYFKDGRLIRVDSTSQLRMTHMLAKNRCDFLIMGDDNARAVMTRMEFCGYEFFQSPNIISSVDIVLALRPHLTDVKKRIDKQLASFINSGERDKSIMKHTGEEVFPKLKCVQ